MGKAAVGSHAMRAFFFFPAFCILLLSHNALSFYLPGVAPEDFQKGDPLYVKVNKLTSIKTQLPYSFYSLPFCHPDKIVDSRENLGEVLRGDRIENSPYVVRVGESINQILQSRQQIISRILV